jgi:hypothetical protein
MSTAPAPDRGDGLRASEAVAAAAAAGAGIASAYWDDAWHTTLGRDSALIPPHLLLYASIAFVGLLLAVWGLRVLRRGGLLALLRAPGLALAASAAGATVVAAPADAFWHAAFGRDAVLWSPPHLLSVVATAVLLTALLLGAGARVGFAGRAALGGALLGATQIAVMEYDTDVPQFPEALYLPLLVATALGAGWVIVVLSPSRAALAAAVAGYVALRVLVMAALGAAGWIAPDPPVALLGLLALALRAGAWRWPLAAGAIAVLQVAAAATGASSVALLPAAQSAAALAALLGACAAVLGARAKRAAAAGLAGALLVAVLVVAQPAPPAGAHDPGQGASFGSAVLSVDGDGSGRVVVTVEGLELAGAPAPAPIRLLGRRAGQEAVGQLSEVAGQGGAFVGSLVLPGPGLWFVYAQFDGSGRTVEAWLPVDSALTGTLRESRDLYEPVGGAGSGPPGRAVLGGALLAGAAGLLAWAAAAVSRRRVAPHRARAGHDHGQPPD